MLPTARICISSAVFSVNDLLTSNREPSPKEVDVSLSPNPSGYWLRIRINETYPIGKVYQVLDLLGKKPLSGRIGVNGSIDISSLAPGTYFLGLLMGKSGIVCLNLLNFEET